MEKDVFSTQMDGVGENLGAAHITPNINPAKRRCEKRAGERVWVGEPPPHPGSQRPGRAGRYGLFARSQISDF